MIIYAKTSPDNTAPTLGLAFEKASELRTDVILATSTGSSAFAAVAAANKIDFNGRIIAVTSVWGMGSPGQNPLSGVNRQKLSERGVVTVTAAHALSGVERSISNKFKGLYPAELIAHTLRLLSEGVKVCVEIGAMAMDAGCAEYGRPAVVIGGTGRGLDTACVMTPSYSAKLFETRIHEILCKPY